MSKTLSVASPAASSNVPDKSKVRQFAPSAEKTVSPKAVNNPINSLNAEFRACLKIIFKSLIQNVFRMFMPMFPGTN